MGGEAQGGIATIPEADVHAELARQAYDFAAEAARLAALVAASGPGPDSKRRHDALGWLREATQTPAYGLGRDTRVGAVGDLNAA